MSILRKILCSFACAGCALTSASAGYVVNDDFEDGMRHVYNPPQSLSYFSSQNSETLTESQGVLRLLSSDGNRYLMAAVGGAGEYVELGDGETLSLEIDFRLKTSQKTPGWQLRLGWFDSGIQPGDKPMIFGDEFGAISEAFRNVVGYQAAVSLWTPSLDANPILLLKRNQPHGDLLFAIQDFTSAYSRLGQGGVGAASSEELNILQFNIKRIEDYVEVSVIILAGSRDRGAATEFFYKSVDLNDPYFRFDHIAIGLNAGDGSVDCMDIEGLRIFTSK